MDTFLLFSILVLISIIVVLMLTLVDQMREVRNAVTPAEAAAGQADLADEDAQDATPQATDPGAGPDGAFGGISGKKLWDLMTGKPLPDLDPSKATELRPRYQVILSKHIEELFHEGAEHSRSGSPKPAANRRTIQGLRGAVVSWIPQPQADTIYQAGFDSTKASDASLATLRSNLTEACNALFSRTGLEPNGTQLVQKLLPGGSDNLLDSLSPEEAALLGDTSPQALPAPETAKAAA
jgi:hypothetical protein